MSSYGPVWRPLRPRPPLVFRWVRGNRANEKRVCASCADSGADPQLKVAGSFHPAGAGTRRPSRLRPASLRDHPRLVALLVCIPRDSLRVRTGHLRRPPAQVSSWADRRQHRHQTPQGAIGAAGVYGRLGGAAAAQGGGICTPRSKCVLTEVLLGTGYAQIQRCRDPGRPLPLAGEHRLTVTLHHNTITLRCYTITS
ncbi:hypothetical protein BDD16_004592 [Sphaerotilus montanus]|uniref:Uncharacterized protein n=1 Tax=Sphaerotilus montanus TaxID=522889 RepID=A0A7Y9R4M9_9BURK|nr:hypothetical protein [Sphaerotilus montanus]